MPVVGIMRPQYVRFTHDRGLEEMCGGDDAFVQDLVFEKGVLLHREAMAFRDFQNIARSVGNVHS